MTQLFTNKKAQVTSRQWLVGLVLAGILILVSLTFISRSGSDTMKVMKKNVASLTNDFDNDGLNDFADDSPCVTGEDTIISDGRTEFYFADPINGVCPTSSYELTLVKDLNTGKDVCILPSKTCAQELKKFYDQLAYEEDMERRTS